MESSKRAILAELLGTFLLVALGSGAIMAAHLAHLQEGVLVPLAFGGTVALVVRYLGSWSGAHINPAVTLALAAAGRLPRRLIAGYLIAQAGGAVSAALLLRLLMGDVAGLGATIPSVDSQSALVIEGSLTLVLVLVVLVMAMRPKWGKAAPLAIGGTVGLEALLAGGSTGASMNPARSLGPALVSGQMNDLWVYLAGPVLGGLVALALVRATLQVLSGSRPQPAEPTQPMS